MIPASRKLVTGITDRRQLCSLKEFMLSLSGEVSSDLTPYELIDNRVAPGFGDFSAPIFQIRTPSEKSFLDRPDFDVVNRRTGPLFIPDRTHTQFETSFGSWP
jgi:hypothetical protein